MKWLKSKDEFDAFFSGDFYAGLSGAILDFDELELGNGVILRKISAHVTSTTLISFNATTLKAPVTALQDGFDHVITAELYIPENFDCRGFHKITLVRLIAGVLRLWTTPSIRILAISNSPFSKALENGVQNFTGLPLETERRAFALASDEGENLTKLRMEEVVKLWKNAVDLAKVHPEFKLGLETINGGQFIRDPALTLISICGALEALYVRGNAELRFRTALLISSYLYPSGQKRKELYAKILKLYDQRSAAAHGNPKHDADALLDSFEILRMSLMQMIRENRVPSKEQLIDNLLLGSSASSEDKK
jgi:hypothetical protein